MNVLPALLTIPVTISEAMQMLVAAATGFVIGVGCALFLVALLRANGPDEEPAWDDGEEKP